MLSAILAAVAVQSSATQYAVQPYYVYPSDQSYHREYVDAINKLLPEVQEWYKAKAGVTFKLLPLIVKKGPDYVTMRGGKKPTDEVKRNRQEMPAWWDSIDSAVGGLKEKQVAWVFAQGGGGFAAANLWGDWIGKGIFGDWVLEPISGVREPKAIHSGFATWQVQGGTPKGTTVHELGHAFGLHHPDNYPGKSIMRWHGDYPDTGLLGHEILILRNSPFFGAPVPEAGAPHLAFENADVMRWGQKVRLKGERLSGGDLAEFCTVSVKDLEKANKDNLDQYTLRVAVPTKFISDKELEVVIPENIGPGFIRLVNPVNNLESNIVPVNFYGPEK